MKTKRLYEVMLAICSQKPSETIDREKFEKLWAKARDCLKGNGG